MCVSAGVSAVKVLGGGEWVSPKVGDITSVLDVCPSISMRVNDDVRVSVKVSGGASAVEGEGLGRVGVIVEIVRKESTNWVSCRVLSSTAIRSRSVFGVSVSRRLAASVYIRIKLCSWTSRDSDEFDLA